MFQSFISFLLASTLSLSTAGGNIDNPNNFDDSVLLSVAKIPVQEEQLSPGFISAEAALAVDLESQTTLYERNSSARLSIASLTKLMTAYIVLEENNPDDIVTISSTAANKTGSRMGLYEGETITIRNLLYGLLIKSGNDAAVALAEFNAGSESAFVNKMNTRAQELGMFDTHFTNTTGLDSEAAYSSARDMTLLSSHLARDPNIREIVKLSSTEVTSTSGYVHRLVNTNILLGQLGIKGLKTGKTPGAGECLITLAESEDGHEILTIVLGSDNRFADTKILVDWIYRAYSW